MVEVARTKGCGNTTTGEPRIRRSRSTRFRVAVLLGVHALVALHLAHYWLSGRTLSPVEPSEAMELSKHSIVNAGAIFFAATILLTFVFGRFFCGWGCHLVALQDLCRAMLLRVGIRPRPLRSRVLALVPLAAFLYMFVWPFAWRVWHRHDLGPAQTALTTDDFWRTFPGWGIALLTFAVCGFVIVYFLGAKGFCTYACPYGAVFGLADRFAPGRIRVTDACEGCGHCTATCTSNVDVAREVREFGMVVDAGCMKCLDCVSVCPKGALYFGFGKPAVLAKARVERKAPRRSLPRREEALALVFFLAAFFTFRGLYGRVPFLLALGIGSSLAFLYVLFVRLLRREPASLPGLLLARDSRLTRAGNVTLACLLLFLPFWAHSAFVRYEAWRAESLFGALAHAREAWFTPERSTDEATRARFRALGTHAARVERFALLDDPRVTYALAWCALADGDGPGFLERSARVLKSGLRTAELHLARAQVEHSAGRLDEAETDWRRALELEPHSPVAWSGLAEVLARRGAIGESRALLERAVRELPENARLQHDLAIVATNAGDAGAARAALARALELDPLFLDARVKLATLELAAEHRDEALRLLVEGARLAPDRIDAHRARIELAESLGDEPRLREALDEALARFPDDEALRAQRAALPERPGER